MLESVRVRGSTLSERGHRNTDTTVHIPFKPSPGCQAGGGHRDCDCTPRGPGLKSKGNPGTLGAVGLYLQLFTSIKVICGTDGIQSMSDKLCGMGQLERSEVPIGEVWSEDAILELLRTRSDNLMLTLS